LTRRQTIQPYRITSQSRMYEATIRLERCLIPELMVAPVLAMLAQNWTLQWLWKKSGSGVMRDGGEQKRWREEGLIVKKRKEGRAQWGN
jgi:hypothetical protein